MGTTIKRALVAGGAGFIGSYIVERLLKSGRTIYCLDNFRTGSCTNLAGGVAGRPLEIVIQDACEPIDIEVDEIWNLACPASPIRNQADPIHTTRTSVLGALNVLDLAERLGCPVLHTSTSEVYEDPLVQPQTETYWGNVNPIGVRACYDAGKRCAETLVFDCQRQHSTSIKVARIFNTCGPGMHPSDGRVVSNFIVQALRWKEITVFGAGQKTRSFCYVDDVVEGLMRPMESDPKLVGPANLGNPFELTVRELVSLVLKLTGSRSQIVNRPLPSDDPTRRKPDISLARSALGWEPALAVEEGVSGTMDYFRTIMARDSLLVE